MEEFYKKTKENTLPLLIYLATSFSSVFVSDLVFLSILFLLFIIVSSILFNNKILLKIIILSMIVIPLIILLSMLFSWNFNANQLLAILPKSISFSILITSSISFFAYLPTFQLFRISKTLINSNYPAYALLAGFRTFPVFFQFSKRIFTAIKIRKAYTSYFNLLILYLQNIIIEFLNFLDEFINRFSFLNISKLQVKTSLGLKAYIAIIYFITSIIFVIYGNKY